MICRRAKDGVERLMRKNGIKARHKRRFKATIDSRHTPLERNFQSVVPNQAWSADLTSIRTDEGWLYLAIVLDLFNREVIGCSSIKPRMTADIVVDALSMVRFGNKPTPGLIHHSDRCSRYGSHAFQARL